MSELIKSEVSNTLNTEEEYNILFSDLFGTLLSEENINTDEDIKKEVVKVLPILNKYLSCNNFLSIITSVNHSTPEYLVEIFHSINDGILSQYKDKIFYFMSDISKNPLVLKKYGCGNSANIQGLKVWFIDDKSEAVDITLKKLKGYKIKDIGAIGDTYHEFRLLNKISNLGGFTGVIGCNHEINNIIKCSLGNIYNGFDIISKIAELELQIRRKSLITCFFNKGLGNKTTLMKQIRNIVNLPEYKDIIEKKDNRIKELTELFENGEISLEELKRILYLDYIAYDELYISDMPHTLLSLDKAEEVLNKTYVMGENFSFSVISENKGLLETNMDIKKICSKTNN